MKHRDIQKPARPFGHRPCGWGAALAAALVFLCAAQAPGADETVYDENTEIVLTGTVAAFPPAAFRRGMHVFLLRAGGHTYRVLTAPRWFLRRIGFTLQQDEKVTVVGSKFYDVNGELALLAREVRFPESGRVQTFRDAACRPVWRNPACRNASCIRVFHSAPAPAPPAGP
ncbi:hypothetical protein G3N55_06570 [Dissulfurirhabdus thermomarina]|uniref:Magnetosome protein MamS/MamX domain-containing protein n=1 Tax=Dissulfurirhabdus thermomarina TaxID=1765737 RepID=A0A6N9TMP0_DISTH|nr:hypothetical protein [Dissulfurirhabdus thermomarina]NDY42505.1 hypothetical protein [Dissulfurirhabdus thermomarina]NMX24193.1 hypothetical protein [Dissulfurirhabdus thermomarina]